MAYLGGKKMRIATLSIGDELLCGQVTDTNAGVIAAALLDNGLRVQRHMAVGDNELDIMEALTDLHRNCDVIIATGGLGPTVDDMTTHAVARATGRRLVVSEEARGHVQRMTEQMGIGSILTSPLADKQVMLPTKTTLIHNPTGTACGFHLIHNNCYMFFMPGVPSEMQLMLVDAVIPFLIERLPRRREIVCCRFNVFGPREAEVDELLRGIARPSSGLSLGICVGYPGMQITLRAEADSREESEALLAPSVSAVRRRLGAWLCSEGDETLAGKVAGLFRSRDQTLALAESCTGGMIAQMVTAVAGSSQYFQEGAITYSNTAKMRQLGVPFDLLNQHGAVSAEVATAMSRGIRAAAGSDVGLAVTGIAGPEGGTEEKPVGTVYISLSDGQGDCCRRYSFRGSREQIRIMTAWTALDRLRRHLQGTVVG